MEAAASTLETRRIKKPEVVVSMEKPTRRNPTAVSTKHCAWEGGK